MRIRSGAALIFIVTFMAGPGLVSSAMNSIDWLRHAADGDGRQPCRAIREPTPPVASFECERAARSAH